MEKIDMSTLRMGDAVSQLQRIVALGDSRITSGPDAFLYDFLSKIRDESVYIVSRAGRNAIYNENNISARVYKANGNAVIKLFRRIVATTDLFIRLMLYKPTQIICGRAGGFLWASFIVSSLYTIPIIYSCHNRVINQREGLLKLLFRFIDNWCIRHCKSIICHGPYLRDQLIAIGVPSSKIIEFDVGFSDLYQRYTAPVHFMIPGVVENSRVILYVGRIEKEKGVFDLLEACAEVLTESSNVFLVYIGKGSVSDELLNAAERIKLIDKIRFLGYLNHEKIVDVIRHSTLLVTPTRIEFPEGRCMSAMEGIVFGLPVIAPDFGPFPYLIQHDFNGLLYKPNSVSDLHNKIMILMKDSEHYNRLKKGARVTGDRLLEPDITFGEAVHRAFSN